MLGPGYASTSHILSRCLNLYARYLNIHILVVLFCHCCCCPLSPHFVSVLELKFFKENSSNCIMSLARLKNGTENHFCIGILLDLVADPQQARCNLIVSPLWSALVRVYRAVSPQPFRCISPRDGRPSLATGSSCQICYMNLQLMHYCP